MTGRATSPRSSRPRRPSPSPGSTAAPASSGPLGLVGRRSPVGCAGVQVGLSGMVFAQFDLDAASTDLGNADYVADHLPRWR